MKIKNIFKKTIKKKVSSGFTLIETMVAITVLLTAIVGPMEIASKSLFSAFYARDQITAYYLAQEGIEYLKFIKDSYYQQASPPSDWPGQSVSSDFFNRNNFSDCVVSTTGSGASVGCKIDVVGQNISKCSGDCGKLNYDDTTGLYSYGPGSASKFTRVVTVTQDSDPNALLVTSNISWTGSYLSGGVKSFTLKEVLYKWNAY